MFHKIRENWRSFEFLIASHSGDFLHTQSRIQLGVIVGKCCISFCSMRSL